MRKPVFQFNIILLFLVSTPLLAQNKEAGPVIENYGKVWKVENPDFTTDTTKKFKVVFDIMNSPDSHSEINKSIETAARFLNMHAQSGITADSLKVVLVVHNKASKDIITNAAYQDRYGLSNPNAGMVQELLDAGVDIIFCGQSSLSRDIPISDTIKGVELALSAMTALIQLQDDGYQLIKF